MKTPELTPSLSLTAPPGVFSFLRSTMKVRSHADETRCQGSHPKCVIIQSVLRERNLLHWKSVMSKEQVDIARAHWHNPGLSQLYFLSPFSSIQSEKTLSAQNGCGAVSAMYSIAKCFDLHGFPGILCLRMHIYYRRTCLSRCLL